MTQKMFLEAMPRYEGCTAVDIATVETYLQFLHFRDKYGPSTMSFEEWHGEYRLPPEDAIEHFKQSCDPQTHQIIKVLHCWKDRKEAEAIHKWFVDNIQNGLDDGKYHREATEKDLQTLRHLCREVITNANLEPGKILVERKGNTAYEDGYVVNNPQVCENLLPLPNGNRGYDQHYLNSLRETVCAINRILNDSHPFDFKGQAIYYVAR